MSDKKLNSTRNSPKSTKCTKGFEVGLLNAEDICKILRTCKESGVFELELGPMRACFGTPEVLECVPGAEPPKAALPPDAIQQVQQQVEETSLVEEEIRAKEERLANLIVEDPLAFEEMLADGELEVQGANGSGEEALDI